MSRAKTQEDAVLEHLRAGKTITALEALDLFGCFRLGARIWDLKKRGHSITKDMVKTPGGATVAKYRWAGPPALSFTPAQQQELFDGMS